MTDAATVLTAMLTPAVLISACGSLVISTSNRLTRVVDRVRQLAAEAENLRQAAAGPPGERGRGDPRGDVTLVAPGAAREAAAAAESADPAADPQEARRQLVRDQFDLLARRAVLLRESLTRLYVSIALLVVTSLAIAAVALVDDGGARRWDWIPVALGLIGAGGLFSAVVVLVREARLAVDSNLGEIAFARERVGVPAPPAPESRLPFRRR